MHKFLFSTGLALTGLLVAPAQAQVPAKAPRLCVSNQDVASTDSKDGKNLVFKLRDGRTLVNHLQGSCSDLRFGGFVWVLHGDNRICEDQQTLRTINSGQVCLLGKFEDVTKSKPVKVP